VVNDRTSPLRVVVTDPIISRFGSVLQAAGRHEWIWAADWDADQQRGALQEADAVVCSRLPAELASAARSVRMVHVTGAGFEKIALDALRPEATVVNTFHHARPIAEHVLMVALMLTRRVLPVDREVRSGVWRTIATSPDVPFHPTLEGRVLGLVGLGSIGAEVGRLAVALGMRVQAVRDNPHRPAPADLAVDWVGSTTELPRLLATSDIVAITVPLNEATRGMIGSPELSAMKDSALLINVARGAVVDEEALFGALQDRSIAGAGIDVWWDAPAGGGMPPTRYDFASLDNVVLTPHYSGHALVTFQRRAADIAANLDRLADGIPLTNVVRAGAASE
jgi:phosphoglycerate dehydrogenase-like enzyme